MCYDEYIEILYRVIFLKRSTLNVNNNFSQTSKTISFLKREFIFLLAEQFSVASPTYLVIRLFESTIYFPFENMA